MTDRLHGGCSHGGAACGHWRSPAVRRPGSRGLVPHHATYKLTSTAPRATRRRLRPAASISYDFAGQRLRRLLHDVPPDDRAAAGRRRIAGVRHALGHLRGRRREAVPVQHANDLQQRASRTTSTAAPPSRATASVAVALDKPETAKATLKTALFPTEHLRKVIAAARGGQRSADRAGLRRVGHRQERVRHARGDRSPRHRAGRRQGRRRSTASRTCGAGRCRSAISTRARRPQPDYVLSFDLYENGISRALKLDYGTFVLAGELTDLKILPTPPCKQ